jgi:hypothetical protein
MRTTLAVFVLLSLPVLAAPKSSRGDEDGSGPRAALLMYDKIVGPNEADKALGLYQATTTREKALAAALAKCDGALSNLHQKAEAKFGAAVADKLVQALDGTTRDEINEAKISVAGDAATVVFPRSSNPTTMVRVDRDWRISVKSIAQQVGNLRGLRKALGRVAGAANDVATKIEQGQVNADAAEKALKSAYAEAFKR